jgi:hypothetical protein
MSPWDVEPAPLPEKLVTLLWNDDGTKASYSGRPTREVLHAPVPDGERNNSLYRFAVAEAFRAGPMLDDEREQQDLLLKIRAVNSIQCRPPLGDPEVMSLYRSAVAYVRKSRAAGVDAASAIQTAEHDSRHEPTEQPAKQQALKAGWKTFTASGLSFTPIGPNSAPEFGPGDWELVVVHSDPLEYRLTAPAWKPLTPQRTGSVSLTVDQYRSATKVAAAVLAATGTVMLDDEPKKWRQIWDGGYKIVDEKDAAGKVVRQHVARGVKAKLLDNASHEWPGASSQRYVTLAAYLYDRLSQAAQPDDDDVPDPSGRACWRQDGTLWFAWSTVWEDVEKQHRIMEGERLALKRRILSHLPETADFRHEEFRHLGGARKSYVVWTPRELGVLESIACVEPPVPLEEQTPPAPPSVPDEPERPAEGTPEAPKRRPRPKQKRGGE